MYVASHASMGREITSVFLKEKCMPLAGGQSGLATRNTNEAGGETFSRFFPVLKRFIMRRWCPAITIWNGSKLLFRLPESGLSKCEGRWPAQAQVLRGVTTAVWSGQAQRMIWSRLGPPKPTSVSRLGKIERKDEGLSRSAAAKAQALRLGLYVGVDLIYLKPACAARFSERITLSRVRNSGWLLIRH